jgi:hypothetical protein
MKPRMCSASRRPVARSFTGYHFPFLAVGTIVPDGAGYTFVPAA